MEEGERVAAEDPVEMPAGELRILLRKGAVEMVDPLELAILHHIMGDQQVSGRQPRVMSLQPVLDVAIVDVADPETRMALEVLLGQTDCRYRSMKERGTKAAKIVGVGNDAYRRANMGRMHRDLLVLAAQIVVQHPDTLMAAGAESVDVGERSLKTREVGAVPGNGLEQQDWCEHCGSDIGRRTLGVV